MRQSKRQVTDKAVIMAMLDQMDTIYLGIQDEPWPYVVPLNFGYSWKEELVFFFHCAREGHKLDLLRKNPHVCVTASQFISYAQGSVRGHLHDYRSVIARGIAEEIDREREPRAFERAHELLLMHNHRDIAQVHTQAMQYIALWRVVCREVTAKAEIPPKCPEEVPFIQGKGDGLPLDESHILDAHRVSGEEKPHRKTD